MDTEESIRQRVNDLTEKAINQEMRRIYALYKSSKEEERDSAVKTTTDFNTILENYLKSDAFKDGIIASARASWGGSGYSVELLPDGTWRNLWNNSIGNLYESPGVILRLPTLDTDDMREYVDGGAGSEDDYLAEAFANEEDGLANELREALSE